MKRVLFVIVFLLSLQCASFPAHAQTYKFYQTDNIHNQLRLNIKTGEVYQIQDDGQTFLIHSATTPDNEKTDRYALYKTQNIWTFILLDKWTGKLWQCQYSVEGVDYMGSWVINPNVLSYSESSKFTIEPLVSMYQYYLINEDTGEMWKFQWTTEGEEYRWIEEFLVTPIPDENTNSNLDDFPTDSNSNTDDLSQEEWEDFLRRMEVEERK